MPQPLTPPDSDKPVMHLDDIAFREGGPNHEGWWIVKGTSPTDACVTVFEHDGFESLYGTVDVSGFLGVASTKQWPETLKVAPLCAPRKV